MKKTILIGTALAVGCLALTSCASWMSDEQRQQVLSAYGEMLKKGVISEAQYEALVATAKGSGAGKWLEILGEVGASVVFALTGVRLWRGPIDARKGKVG